MKISEFLNINVTHYTPSPTPTPTPVTPGTPDTGFFGAVGNAISHIGVSGWCFIVLTMILIALSVTFFLLQRRRQHKAYKILSAFFVAATIGFTIPAVHSVTSAFEGVGHTVDFNIETTKTATPATLQSALIVLDEPMPYGYTVSAYFEGVDEDRALYNEAGTQKIESISENITNPELFPDNTYGVKSLVADTYTPLSTNPAEPTAIIDTNEALEAGAPILITYSAKLDNNTPADTYNGTISYTVTAKPAPTLDSLEAEGATMQDERMAVACANTPIPEDPSSTPQYQFKDARDNKMYYVAKLADGKCWMTQNLDLNITTEGLTNELTDLNSQTSWDASSQYAPKETETTVSSSTGYTDTRSWSLGDVYYDGITATPCGNVSSYAECIDKGFNTTGDQHYYVGNLYQWNTATAGTGGTITSQQAPDSICPKGWRLPTSNTDGEFQILMNTYNITSGTETSGDVSKVIDGPFYMVRGGTVSGNKLRNAAVSGFYWSSTADSNSIRAYHLFLNGADAVYPSNNNSRDFGIAVRCVAR